MNGSAVLRRLLVGPGRGVGPTLTDEQLQQLADYLEMLDRWNQRMNLTALEGEARVQRLLVEPLWVAWTLRPSGRYLDVGSGNGSPAIPWQVLRRFARADLVEVRRRRAVFLEQAVARVQLPHVHVHVGRIETVPDLGPFDWVTLQGLRLTRKLYSRLVGLGASGGRLVWLTNAEEPEFSLGERLAIPGARRHVWIVPIGPDPSRASRPAESPT